MRLRFLLSQVFVLLLFIPAIVLAANGSSRATEVGDIPIADTVEFAKQVERSLARHRAKIAILARAGRPTDELPDGVEYTHVGLAVYSRITTADGRTIPGYATYNLYQTTTRLDRSELVQDYMLDFFTGVQSLKAGIIIPNEKLQAKLLQRISDGSWRTLHNSNYSLMSNPYNNRYQNCTEYLLNLVQSAIYGTTDMDMIKHTIDQHFVSYKVRRNPFAVMLGGLFSREIAVTDHPHTFETVTFTSLANYFDSFGLARSIYTLVPD